MDRVTYSYSLKNIALPTKNTYLKTMINKLESFIKNMRWKAYFYDHPETARGTKVNYGFKSNKTPPQNQHLAPFENDLYELTRKIEFKCVQNRFQQQLKSDIREIKQSDKVLVPADKTNNLYKLSVEEYNKLLTDNISKSYKKTKPSAINKVNKEAKSIATKLGIADRVQQYAKRSAFITLKDHKDNFDNNPKCRLINPAKSDIGVISKTHLDLINADIRKQINVNQWRNTSEVLKWFKAIPDKSNCKFIKFDIADFYPSISLNCLAMP